MTDESKREAATSDSTERQAFEAWALHPSLAMSTTRLISGDYATNSTHKAWLAWQARASHPSQAEPVAWRWRLLPYLAQPNRRVRNDWILCSSAAECPENVAPTESWDGSEVQPLYTHPTASSPDAMAVLRAERDHARACLERLAKVLSSIHMGLYPALQQVDGKTMRFMPPNPHDYLQHLSERIRAIPDELERAAYQAKQEPTA